MDAPGGPDTPHRRTDQQGSTVLDEHASFERLRNSEVGRLAVIVDGRPEIFPLNFAVDHGTVVFRTAAGTKLDAIGDGADVAFEVDGYDAERGEAWSVVIKGCATEVLDAYERFDAVDLPLFPWNAAPKPRFVRIVPDQTSGRQFRVSWPHVVPPGPRTGAG
jgi:hypothetical protein